MLGAPASFRPTDDFQPSPAGNRRSQVVVTFWQRIEIGSVQASKLGVSKQGVE